MTTLFQLHKKIVFHRFPLVPFLVFLMIFSLIGCNELELKSQWLNREITIDGNSEDWLDTTMYFREEDVSIGLFNDDDFLYLCLTSKNANIRSQVMGRGLKIWFDPKGGKEKTFGIRFPLGMFANRGKMSNKRGEQDQERTRRMVQGSRNELEILGPGKEERERLHISEAEGTEIKINASSGVFVYELKVPLMIDEQHPYAIGTGAGRSIGVGFETAALDLEMMKRGMGGRIPGGVGRPGMGGRRGMGGAFRGPGMTKSFKLWSFVKLAEEKE